VATVDPDRCIDLQKFKALELDLYFFIAVISIKRIAAIDAGLEA
jgi:hypothetical protein